MFSKYLTLAVSVLTVDSVTSLPYHHQDNQVDAAFDPGTFQNPSINVRPKFRYWLPDASVDPDLLAADIKEIGELGAAGIQFLNYYNYGGLLGPEPTDWSIYGFGTDAYNTVLRAAAQATSDNGLLMDFCMGPQSGQGVPAEYDNPGLAYSLVSYNVTVEPGGSYTGPIPGAGSSGTLVSISTAMITKAELVNGGTALTPAYDHMVYTLAADSLTDVTSTSSDGTISVSFPANNTAINYMIYASYYELSGERACIPGLNPQNFIQNGSFAVDHFSANGAKVTTDFLEQYVLVNGTKEIFQEIGNYIWEDSVEVHSTLYWTPDLAATFQQMHGYDIGKYTMLLAQLNGLEFSIQFPDWYQTDASDLGQGFVSDYRATMVTLLNSYYQHFVNWSSDYLGLEFSAQVGYNLPVDMLEIIPTVGVPEDEELMFNNATDAYRQYVGSANLAGKRIISNEMGATPYKPYQQTLPMLLQGAKVAWSVGNNQLVIHGAEYSYNYTGTTWPGYTSFDYQFSEHHSRHQPAWRNGYAEYLEYISRTQWVLQAGIPKRDLAFWDKQTSQDDNLASLYSSLDLIQAGYGYEYISPGNFILPNAIVTNGVFAEAAGAYKAFIIRQTDVLTTDGVNKLAEYANDGLPIIIVDGIPDSIASPTGLTEAQATLQNLTSLSNIYQTTSGALAGYLPSIGIQPLTKVSSNSTWYTYWRSDAANQTDYIFIHNDGDYSEGTISFASINRPYIYDAWTGEQTPVVSYTVADNYTTIPFQLALGQTALVAFLDPAISTAPILYITSAPTYILGFSYDSSQKIIAQVPASTTSSTIITSDNIVQSIPAQDIPTTFALGNWTLIAERWGPSPDLYNLDPDAEKTNVTIQLPTLASWPDIPGLANTSGVGYYSTTFPWNDISLGAIIDFGRVVHTLRVKVNGNPLPPLDFTSAKADISQFLIVGDNLVEATAATVLWNTLIPIFDQLQVGGQAPLSSLDSGQWPVDGVEEGLVETVMVTPFRSVNFLDQRLFMTD